MIVEDEAIVALDLEDQLSALGFAVVGLVRSGEHALPAVANTNPDLILMDIRLADSTDGIETATRVREAFAIPVIFLTALTDPSTRDRAKTSEAYGYLVKPFAPLELRAAIEMALFNHAAERERQWLPCELLQTHER